MTILWTIGAVALSYVAGSVPTGLWLGLGLRGVDIRQHGSKNIGATNTMRVLGKKLGAAALAGDVAKGAISVLVFSLISPWPYAALACGIAAIVGHTAPIFLKFKGGKGVATSAGVFLALCPIPTLVAAVVFFAVVAFTRMVSAGSLSAAVVLAAAVCLLPHKWVTFPAYQLPEGLVLPAVAGLVALLVIVRHRTNIVRILKGEENRI
jgi:glycerol-3-phosphate acyltransferase PlsY